MGQRTRREHRLGCGSVRPEGVAAIAVHLMTDTALTGATYDIDDGQQSVAVKEESCISKNRSSYGWGSDSSPSW